MVHAYLMYGFPTQTVQETIDSLEMVRQMFETGVLQSAFWHLFTMTAHSPVGLDPAAYKVKKQTEEIGTFANNDIQHEDPTGANHELFGYGLKKALFNYMHGTCFDFPLHKWFDFKVPATTIANDYIQNAILEPELSTSNHYKTIWIGTMPTSQLVQKSKKGNKWEEMQLQFQANNATFNISIDPKQADWFLKTLPQLSVDSSNGLTIAEIKASYQAAGLEGFELFWDNKPIAGLHKAGLLRL
jgi:hypothetical protein